MTYDPSEETVRAMTCCEVAEWTSVYLEGQGYNLAKLRMVGHLASCADCRAYVGQIESVRDALKSMPGPVISSVHRDRLRQAFKARLRPE